MDVRTIVSEHDAPDFQHLHLLLDYFRGLMARWCFARISVRMILDSEAFRHCAEQDIMLFQGRQLRSPGNYSVADAAYYEATATCYSKMVELHPACNLWRVHLIIAKCGFCGRSVWLCTCAAFARSCEQPCTVGIRQGMVPVLDSQRGVLQVASRQLAGSGN